MELIKKIKQAETEAQHIVEKTRAEAAEKAEHGQQKRTEALAQAEHKRNKAIEEAVNTAQSQGLDEAKTLKTQAQNNRQQLRNKVDTKIAGAVTRLTNYLKG